VKVLTLICILLTSPAFANFSITEEWRDTFNRCQVGIETGTEFSVRDMTKGTVQEGEKFIEAPVFMEADDRKIAISAERPAPDILRKSLGGRFWLAGWEHRTRDDDKVRRTCEVTPVDPLDAEDILELQQHFLNHRDVLVQDGTHMEADLPFIRDTLFYGFAPLKRSPSDFCIISTLSIARDDETGVRMLESGTHEQVSGSCSMEEIQ
jgi:hypothetical protein